MRPISALLTTLAMIVVAAALTAAASAQAYASVTRVPARHARWACADHVPPSSVKVYAPVPGMPGTLYRLHFHWNGAHDRRIANVRGSRVVFDGIRLYNGSGRYVALVARGC